MIRILKMVLIGLLSLITIGVLVFLVLVLTNKIDVKDFKISFGITHSKKVVVDKEYENIYKEIEVKTEAADIEIKDSKNDKIRVVVYSDKDRTKVNSENEKLEVVTKSKKCVGICINQKIDKVILYLPDNYNLPISLKTNYGDIKTNEISNLTANTNYGDIKITKANSYFKIITNYGDIKINEVNITKDSKAITNYGDIKVNKTNSIYIKAKTDLGDKDINKNNKKSNITLELNTNLGDVKAN